MAESWSNRSDTVYGVRQDRDSLYTQTPTSSTSKQPRLNVSSSRTCNNTPGYASYIREGRPLPANAFSYSKRTTLYPVGAEQNWTTFGSDVKLSSVYQGCLGPSQDDPMMDPGTGIPSGIKARCQRLATNKLLQSVQDKKNNMGTMMAEAGKTMTMIGQTATKIGNSLRQLRKGNLVGAAQGLGLVTSRRSQRRFNRTARKDQEKAIASAWLEMQYGWKPLLSNVYNAARQMADNVAPIYKCSGYGSYSENLASQSTKVVNYYDYNGTNIESVSGHCEVRMKCTYIMSNSTAHRAAMNGLTNPLEVAWELVPYSFVIDWFLPIGNYLALLDATSGLSFQSGYVTTYLKVNASRQRTINGSRKKRVSMQGVETIEIDRGKLGSWPSVSFPEFQSPVTLGHTLNAMALLSNLRK